jgi:gag-polypeptide of LTR copia-type/Domain of unknown function (DUF4219)/Zinc knuckle
MTDSSSVVRFNRLNDTNYAEWALRMEAVLVQSGLWSMIDLGIDPTGKDILKIAEEKAAAMKKRTANKMNEARAAIILRVEDGQLAHCLRSRDPKEIWDVLESVHRAAGFATSLALRRRFLTMKKEDSQTMQSWIGQVQALAFRLEHAGIKVEEQDKILALTMGLPNAYDAVIINFDSTSPDQLTLSHVISRLLNEEVRQLGNENSTKSEHDEAMMVTSATTKGRRLGAKATTTGNPDVTCYFCDKKGHYKSECPERLAWEKSKGHEEVAAGVEDYSEDDAF